MSLVKVRLERDGFIKICKSTIELLALKVGPPTFVIGLVRFRVQAQRFVVLGNGIVIGSFFKVGQPSFNMNLAPICGLSAIDDQDHRKQKSDEKCKACKT